MGSAEVLEQAHLLDDGVGLQRSIVAGLPVLKVGDGRQQVEVESRQEITVRQEVSTPVEQMTDDQILEAMRARQMARLSSGKR